MIQLVRKVAWKIFKKEGYDVPQILENASSNSKLWLNKLYQFFWNQPFPPLSSPVLPIEKSWKCHRRHTPAFLLKRNETKNRDSSSLRCGPNPPKSAKPIARLVVVVVVADSTLNPRHRRDTNRMLFWRVPWNIEMEIGFHFLQLFFFLLREGASPNAALGPFRCDLALPGEMMLFWWEEGRGGAKVQFWDVCVRSRLLSFNFHANFHI